MQLRTATGQFSSCLSKENVFLQLQRKLAQIFFMLSKESFKRRKEWLYQGEIHFKNLVLVTRCTDLAPAPL